MQPINYIGKLKQLPAQLALQSQLTEIAVDSVDDSDKWTVMRWSKQAPFPELPGDLLATTGFELDLPWAKTWAYPIIDNPLNIGQDILQGLVRAKRVVCPTEALAELLADGLGYRPGVIRPGVPAGRPLDPQRTEYGREELRQALWTGLQDDHLVIIADWLAGADELIAAVAGLNRPDVRLIFRESGEAYQAPLDQLLVLNDLDPKQVMLMSLPAGAHTPLLFNAADLYIPAKAWSSDIELAMACGCIPCVPDIDFWAERVDQQRGVELPTYLRVTDDGTVFFNYDPHGVAQMINQLTPQELRQRRANGLAWAQNPANSWQQKVTQWRQVLGA